MTSTIKLTHEPDFNNQRYLRSLAEGMKEWIEVKSLTGNQEIKQCRKELEKEIIPSKSLPNKIFDKMKSLGIRRETLTEFKGVFSKKIRPE
jgi:hypothetical protein